MSNNHGGGSTDVLLEDINSKFDKLIEVVYQMREEIKSTATKDDLVDVKSDLRTVKAAVTDVSSQVNNHENRITRLETVQQ